jgi:Ca-activated chloride channel family protein
MAVLSRNTVRALASALVLALAAIVLTSAAVLLAQPRQEPRASAQQLPTFSSGVSLVEVYATVTSRAGEPVTGLSKDQFELTEDGVPQRIEAFAAGDFPLSVALAVDRSASMAGEPLALAKAAGRAFLSALRPEDRAMVVSVSSRVEVVSPLSNERAAQRAALESLQPWSSTALHDAIAASIEAVQGTSGRRALVLLSDGRDRYSELTATEALERARRFNVMVYPIAVGEGDVSPLFAQLAVVTGGRSAHVRDPRRLTATLEGIARELRLQYLLGYTPSRSVAGGEPEWRSIQVRVRQPGLRVRARDGYFTR